MVCPREWIKPRDLDINDLLRRPAAKLPERERAVPTHDEVDLEGTVHVDDVEHRPTTKRVASDVSVDIEPMQIDPRQELLERGKRWIDNDVEIVRGSRMSVRHARERTDNHVRNLCLLQEARDLPQQAGNLRRHGASNGAVGHARAKRSSPTSMRNRAQRAAASSYSG